MPKRPHTVLVVEDNDITRKMIRVTLAAAGYHVIEAADGKTALEVTAKEEPILIVQDLILPDIHGLELLKQLRALPGGADRPVIACTGFLPTSEEARASAAGFSEFLLKPVEPSLLTEVVRAYTSVAVPRAARPGAGKRVLVVDDDPVQLKLARLHLEGLGFNVETAADGEAALAAANRTPPDAILADVLMPRMDGFKLCLNIRQHPTLGRTPVVLQSSKFTEDADRNLAKRVGANAYLTRSPDNSDAATALLASLTEPVPPHEDLVGENYSEYVERIVHQLERQSALNTGLVQRYSQLASALSVLGATSEALATEQNVEDVLHDILYRCIDAAGISVGVLYLAEPAGGFGVHTAAGHQLPKDAAAAAFFGCPELLERAYAGDAAVSVPSRDVPDGVAKEFLGRLGLATALLVPVAFRDTRLGVMLLGSNTRDVAGEDWTGFARVVSGQLGQAVALNTSFQALHRSEERYRALFEQNPHPMWVVDNVTYRFLAVNAAAVEHYGYSRDDFLSMTALDIREAGEADRFRRTMAESREGLQKLSGWRHRKKNGTLIDVDVSAHAITFGDRAATLALITDVTERRQVQAALRDREERFTQLADHISEVFFVVDAQYRETLYISPAYETVWGRTRQSLYDNPRSFLDAVEPEDRAALIASIAEVQKGHDPGEVEFRVVRPDGQVRFVLAHAVPVRNAQGEVYRIAGVTLDITDRKRAEDAVRLSEERFRALVEHAGDAIALLNNDGVVTYATASSTRVLGYEAHELIGRNIRELVHAEDLPGIESELASARGRPEMIVTLRGRLRHRDGTLRWMDGTLTNRIADPAVRALVLNFRDVTAQRTLEQQFMQSQRMEAVGHLAGGVAHDFNNLLTIITSYSEVLLSDLAPTDPRREDVDEIKLAGDRAAALTRQLLAFSRQQILEPRVLDLNNVARGTEKLLRRLIGEDIEFRTVFSERIAPVCADPGQIEQVIMNLAVNARDAMPDGGTLTIETTTVEGGTALRVHDTGTGMPDDVKARIFEPFFTTKERGKGTGLGLATVYGIVKQSGGDISVESTLGRGTVFTIVLPAASQAPAPEVPRGESEARGGSETVLLLEDEESVRRIARTVLTRHGYTVLEAKTGDEALAILESARGAKVELLLTDLVLPGMSGLDVAREATHLRPSLRILFMSGYTDRARFAEEVVARGRPFLQKPFGPGVLANTVRSVLDSPVAAGA